MDSHDDESRTARDGESGPPPAGIAALSLPYQLVAAVALAVTGVLALLHVGMIFLHVAPPNTITKQHGEAVSDWIYPEFEQNWKLFAPNPLQQNIAVQVRAQVRRPDGELRTTGWRDLSAEDGAAIDGNPVPSHTQQNELRRAWDFYTGAHADEDRSSGLRGELSERYIRRIVMLRLGTEEAGGTVERIQLRSRATAVAPPDWSDERIDTKPVDRTLPWWTVTEADLPDGREDPEPAGRPAGAAAAPDGPGGPARAEASVR
ncbi:DUF5819 family protein [Streptomyces sp. GC420]|uniref:DUF5819 family protein n=1 Tax=Streptomyces sp. GC420 TaxID=2697568 RepID=UPI001FB72139|nr:DUF5819 family protein [Streptomyces sp. GC420]